MDQPQPAVGINLSQRDQHHFNFSGEDPRESDLRRSDPQEVDFGQMCGDLDLLGAFLNRAQLGVPA